MILPIDAILSIGSKVLDKVFPDPTQAEQAKLKLLEMQQSGELAKIQADTAEQHEISERWKADMASDSWLSKNIRPMTLVYILTAFILMAVVDGFGFHISEAYVNLLGQWGMVVMTAYFGGRTLEKVMEMRKGK
jgi:hypothetical protein